MMPLRESYHFIGIGGDGMSALAWLLHERGHSVSGSDLRDNAHTRALQAAGVPIHLGHDDTRLGGDRSVVYSSAIQTNNLELKAATRQSLPVYHRQEVLGQLIASHRTLAIAGTHGKTTTSAMTAALLKATGRDPSYLVGAPSPSLGGHARLGASPWLVAEIDESDGRFRQFASEIGIVCNVGRDHLNTYGSEACLVSAFREFVGQSQKAILSADDPHTELLKAASSEAWTFGLNHAADLEARHVRQRRRATTADIWFQGEKVGQLALPAPGRHNVANALAALLAGHLSGLDFTTMIETLATFQLPERRFQVLEENGRVVVDDYAHLPTQIDVNLDAVRRGWQPRRVIAVFQPHRYSRMSYLHRHFARAFRGADKVIVSDIYPAYESPIPGVSSQRIVETIRREHPEVHYLPTLDDVYGFLRRRSEPGDFIIGFGPGDIGDVLHQVAREGRTR